MRRLLGGAVSEGLGGVRDVSCLEVHVRLPGWHGVYCSLVNVG